ncbi:MAG TPA: PfkB family carbohydrate kinase [Solirubrobacteraceae bacterium]|jgi:sugar/nucleoside kinase (ribokinase family)|nr:PfkB family carbohydrate kinase [Solirubrobacteraceae bacterium]
MSLAVVGSVAFDSVSSPFGQVERQLGGSATYAALAASHFTDVRLVAPVGDDFAPEHYEVLEGRGIDTGAIQLFADAKTFFWRGRYEFDMSVAHSDVTELNVFAGWRPRLSVEARQSEMLFLAAMDPETQLDVRKQWLGAKFAALDSNAYWIKHKPEHLVAAIRTVDLVLMNDLEARELTGEPMLLRAARMIMSWGPRAVVLRLGEYGCALLTADGYFSLPAFPLENGLDPTGCGDAFAGGFLGYLDVTPRSKLTETILRSAVTYGSVMASYCMESFGPDRLVSLSEREINYRFEDFRQMTHFEHVSTHPRARDGAADERDRHPARPGLTPSIRPHDAPHRTPSIQTPPAPHRTPSTERPSPSLKPPRAE